MSDNTLLTLPSSNSVKQFVLFFCEGTDASCGSWGPLCDFCPYDGIDGIFQLTDKKQRTRKHHCMQHNTNKLLQHNVFVFARMRPSALGCSSHPFLPIAITIAFRMLPRIFLFICNNRGRATNATWLLTWMVSFLLKMMVDGVCTLMAGCVALRFLRWG
ncbi:hypothetical protein B0H65DRAFT_453140 [Neurospora tetraspora]|uniref:Uncharacterized protein n=1 Tax=Neurospora tetraspora TaxID=94610 RepID=A0AAE0MXC4_9PEZI|nr:hypothetical protein B0H65DRAFT_453140 [Neurospora tetraspora]